MGEESKQERISAICRKYRKGIKLVVTVKNSVEEKGIVMNIGIL